MGHGDMTSLLCDSIAQVDLLAFHAIYHEMHMSLQSTSQLMYRPVNNKSACGFGAYQDATTSISAITGHPATLPKRVALDKDIL